MKLQQLRYICEVARRNLNVSAAAESMFTSQPGVSKQIRLLEDELGVQIFVRNGKHLTDVTPAGRMILETSERILNETDNIRRIADEFSDHEHGTLTIATTHTQARYALPRVVRAFLDQYPGVQLQMQQGTPMQIAKMAASGTADFAIATEAIELFEDLVMMPCYRWNRCIVVPPGHPLLDARPLTLEAVAEHPIITYVFGFTGRSKLDQAFNDRGLTPNVVLTAADSEVIKTYVALGLGVGIMAKMAYDPERDTQLRTIDASHLFEPSTTNIGFRRGAYLRGFMYDFIQKFAPHLDRDTVDSVLRARTAEERSRLMEGLTRDLTAD